MTNGETVKFTVPNLDNPVPPDGESDTHPSVEVRQLYFRHWVEQQFPEHVHELQKIGWNMAQLLDGLFEKLRPRLSQYYQQECDGRAHALGRDAE
jgi:hypothetical protein